MLDLDHGHEMSVVSEFQAWFLATVKEKKNVKPALVNIFQRSD